MSDANVYKIKKMIENGKVTKSDIKKALGIKATSLATNYTYLRFMNCCPVTDAEGYEYFVTREEYEEIKAERKAKAASRQTTSKKTPQERYELALKRQKRARAAEVKAQNDVNNDQSSDILKFRLDKAIAEANIADYDVKKLEDEFGMELQKESETGEIMEVVEEVIDEEVSETSEELV